MLDKSPIKSTPRPKIARKTRLRTIDVKISLPADGAAAKLAGKIRDSVNRTLANEGAEACSVTLSDVQAEPQQRDTGQAAAKPVGCGAWWNF